MIHIKALCCLTAFIILTTASKTQAEPELELLTDTEGLELLDLEDLFDAEDTDIVDEEIGVSDADVSQTVEDMPYIMTEDELINRVLESGDETLSVDALPEPAPAAPTFAPPTTPKTTEQVALDIVEVSEQFYKLTLDKQSNIYTRTKTTEANPGDLIELVITAVNTSKVTVNDVEMVNTVPAGPVFFLNDSVQIDETKSLYRLSRNGTDFFPAEAQIEGSAIGYIKWLIFSMAPNETLEMRYRIKINE